MSRYRLTITTRRGGTCFCIGAMDDDDAVGQAIRIVSRLEPEDADITLTASATRAKVPLLVTQVSEASAAA